MKLHQVARWQNLASACFLFSLLFLTACSTTLRSEVRTKHQWPQQLSDKSYVIAAARPAPANAIEQTASTPQFAMHSKAEDAQALSEAADEYQHALNLLRQHLSRLGFQELAPGAAANLTVALQYATQSEPVYQLEDVLFAPHNRFWIHSRPWWGHGYARGMSQSIYYGPYFGASYGPYIGPSLAPHLWYYPGFDPLFRGGPIYVYRESPFPNFQRMLRVLIVQNATQKQLFEVQVSNESRSDAIETVLPFMLDSAMIGFPGEDGSIRRIEMKVE